MGGSDVVVIRVAKTKNNEKPKAKWTTVSSLKTKPCFIRLSRLPSSISDSKPVKVPLDEKVARKSPSPIPQTPETETLSPPPPPPPPKSPEVITIPDVSPSQSPSKKHSVKQAKKSVKDFKFLQDPVAQSRILYSNCFKDSLLYMKDPSITIFQRLIEGHRRQCFKCDSQIVAQVSGVTSLYDPNANKVKALALAERQLRETQMILKMSEEARAITDNLYEEKLKVALDEIDTLKRGIQVLMQKEDIDSSMAKIIKHKEQPTLEPKERKYHTSYKFNVMNMTTLREALLTAQKCGHGNLTILESDEMDYLAAKLVFLCQTCQKETVFFTSGFSSKEPAHFTVNSALLKALGESAFYKLVDFVKHAPFSNPSDFVGPLITKEDKDSVKLILGLDKFDFDNWTDLDDGNQSKENLDDVIEVHGKDEKRMVKIKNLEPEINLTHDEPQNEKSSNCLPILDELKMDYIKKNPEKNLSLFPELPHQKPKITPRPLSELLADPSKAHPPAPALIPINNDNVSSVPSVEITPVRTSGLNGRVALPSPPSNPNPPPLIPSTTIKTFAPLPPPSQPVLKIRPSRDLPPGSRILSIPPGTKIMCSNICHSNKKVTGLATGVYRVIDEKNNEKILIVEDSESSGKKPAVVSVLNKISPDGLAFSNPPISMPQNVSSSVPISRIVRKGNSMKRKSLLPSTKKKTIIKSNSPIPNIKSMAMSQISLASSNVSSFAPTAPTITSSNVHYIKIPKAFSSNLQPIPVQDLIHSFTTASSTTKSNMVTNSLLSTNSFTIPVVRTTQSKLSAKSITSTFCPEPDPLALDDPLANEGDIEIMQSSENPLIKLVNILPQETSEQISISRNLIPFPDKRTLSEEDGDRCSIANNGVKRAKIGC